MNNDRIDKLEKSVKLKKKIFSKNIWKNYAIIPPALILFIGILGIVYLLNIDQLVSFYTIPFLIIFILGTIWLKAVRKYLINKKISETETFIVCLAIPFAQKGRDTILLFSTGKNRNNRHYLEKEKRELLETRTDYDIANTKIVPTPKEDIFLTNFPLNKKLSISAGKPADSYRIVYTDDNSIHFLTNDDLRKYL